MCYPICTRERKIPAQSSSSSSSFWNISRLIVSYKCPARDPLKIFSSLTSPWSRAKIVPDRDPLKKNFLSDFTLIASKKWVDRDLLKISSSLTWPDRDHYISCSRSDYDFLQNDLFCFSKTSFHDFHDSYIKSYTKLKLKPKTKTQNPKLKIVLNKN